MQVWSSEVISCWFILWYMFRNFVSTAWSYQNSLAAATENSTFQQKYNWHCLSHSPRTESIWSLDRISASMFHSCVLNHICMQN